MEDFSGVSHYGKRRKKRSFLQKQKRFAKHGSFGCGTPLSLDMYEYFINILKVMNSKKEDEEEMSVLATNVFCELEGKEAEYCCNQIVSRIVENLLSFSSNEEFSKFLEKFSENLRPIFSDTFGSHVLQQTLIVAYTKYKNLVKEHDNKLNIIFYDYILKISNVLFNNLEDYIWDTYSSAVARTVFNVLSGNPVKGEIKFNLETQNESDVSPPNEFKPLIKKFAKRILSWPQFNDLCNRPMNSNFLQSLLLASKNSDECPKLIERIIKYYESSPLDLTDEENDAFVRLLEVALIVSNKANYKEIYKLMFKKQLVELAVSKIGNFAVQKLIMKCENENIFGKIFAKLGSHMEEILNVEHTGVLLALVKGCRRLGLVQADCMTMLMRVLKIKESKELVPSICSFTPSENINSMSVITTLHGCLVVQELLNFKRPINIVSSLLEMPESKLVTLLSDVKGSHMTNAFVTSPTIGGQSRDRLFKKLQGHYLRLVTSKHGSRSLDAIWSVINIQQKTLLAEELKTKKNELYNDIYGKGFAKKIHLDNFIRNKDEWTRLQKTSEAVEKYFADIIPPLPQKKKKRS